MLHVFKPHAPNQVQLRVMESMQQGSLMKLKQQQQQQQQQQHGAQTKTHHGPHREKSALQQHPSTKSAGVHETSSSKRSQQPTSQAHGKLMSTPSPEASPRLDISAPGSPSWKAHSPSPLANATGANVVSHHHHHHQRHAPSPATLPSKPNMAPYTAASGTALPASLRAPTPHKAQPQASQWVGSRQPCTRTVTVYSSKGVVQRTTSTAPTTASSASPSPPGDEGRRRGVKRERDGAAMPPPTPYHHHKHHHHKQQQQPQHFHTPSALCPCFMCFYHLAATMMRAMPHLQPPSQHHHASAPKRQPPYSPPQAPKAPWRPAAATTATAPPAPTTAAAATAASTKASATAPPPPRHHHMATAASSAMYADATAAPQPRRRQRKRQRSAGPIVQPVLVNAATPHSAPLIGSYDCEGDVYTVTIRLDGSIVPPEEVATQPIVVEAD